MNQLVATDCWKTRFWAVNNKIVQSEIVTIYWNIWAWIQRFLKTTTLHDASNPLGMHTPKLLT